MCNREAHVQESGYGNLIAVKASCPRGRPRSHKVRQTCALARGLGPRQAGQLKMQRQPQNTKQQASETCSKGCLSSSPMWKRTLRRAVEVAVP